MFPALPSQKVTSRNRGSVTIGTAGVGYILFRPTMINTGPAALISTAAFTGTVTDVVATGVVSVFPNLPFTGLSDATVQARFVAGGVRVRYTGTELERGGTIISLEHPSHLALENLSEAEISSYTKAVHQQVDREWHSVTWQPIRPSELDAGTTLHPGDSDPRYPLVIFVRGTAGSTYDFEMVQHVEYYGINAPSKTPSYVSPQFEQVVGAASEPSSSKISDWMRSGQSLAQIAARVYNTYRAAANRRQAHIEL